MTIQQDLASDNGVRGGRVSPALQHDVEQFYYREATLLDDGHFREWLELIDDDVRYEVGTRPTLDPLGEDPAYDSLAFEENKESLTWRVKRSETGMAWAEEPPSRTRYLITNVQITPVGDELAVRSNFMLYRNRLEVTAHFLVGSRRDLLRRQDGGFLIAQRSVTLDQNVILSNNLSMFF